MRDAVPFVGGRLLASCTGQRIDGSYVHVYHRLRVSTPLPMPRVLLQGPRCWRFCRDSQPDPNHWRPHHYDFAVDVRELVCEPLAFDRVAMWADPRERL